MDRWVVYWIAMPIALVLFIFGMYYNVFRKLKDIWTTWGEFLKKEGFQSKPFYTVFLYEVLLQRQLYGQDKVRWARHIMIYWGFALLFATDIFFAFSTKFFPTPFFESGSGRLILDFLLDFTGTVLLIGTLLALIRAFVVRGTEKEIYHHAIGAFFLFLVVSTGFLVEAIRIASSPYDPQMIYSFLGYFLAGLFRPIQGDLTYNLLWTIHMLLSFSFIAYMPYSKLVHILAHSFGKLMNSQEALLEGRLLGVASGLLPPAE